MKNSAEKPWRMGFGSKYWQEGNIVQYFYCGRQGSKVGIQSNKQTIQNWSKPKVQHARNNGGRPSVQNIRQKAQTNMTNLQREDMDINTQGWR